MSGTTIPDDAFIEAALKLGALTPERVAEARGMQAAMKKMKIEATLQEVVTRNGMVTTDQVRQIMRSLGAHVDQIPGYRIEKKIGAGGMGTVYKARQLSVDRTVAIKVMSPVLMKDRNFVSRFLNEAKAAALLNHPNIISVHDAGDVDGLFYLVMEFAEGRTLRDLVEEQGPLPEARVKDVGRQMALALSAIHARMLLHRDIKPDNIVLDKRGAAKLCDFGLARSQGETAQSLTTTGMAVGTPLYMSPEQVQGKHGLDIRSDLYSLGATLFHVATGKPPFMAENQVATAMKHLTEPPPHPRTLRAELSEEFSQILLRLLEKEPDRRIQTPQELLRVIHGGRLAPPRPPSMTARLRKRIPLPNWALYTMVAVAGMGLLAVPFWLSGSQLEDKRPPTPPKRVVVDPPPTEAKEDLRAKEAQLKLDGVRLDLSTDDYAGWTAALERLARLEQEFAGLALEDLPKLKAEAAEKIARARRASEEAQAIFEQRRWTEAMAAFEALRPGAMDAPTIAARVDQCRNELDFERLFATLKRYDAEGRWRELAMATQQAPERLRATHGFEASQAELSAIALRTRRELLAQESLFKVRAAAGGEWEGFGEAVKEFESFGDTRAYAAASPEISKLKGERDAASRRGAEEQAEAAYNRASTARREGRHLEARGLFLSFLEKHVSTAFYKANRDAARDAMAACERAAKEAREAEAKAAFSEVKRLKDAREWRKLDESLSKLEAFEDTDTAASQKRAMQDLRKLCDRELEKLLTVALRDDFEKGPGDWIASNDKGKAPALEEWKDAREGKRALKVTFFKAGEKFGDGGGIVARLTNDGIDAGAAVLRWWGKLLGADRDASEAQVLVGFIESVEKAYVEVFAVKVTLVRSWREYVIKVDELECIFNLGGDGKLDLSKARGVGFLNADATKTFTFAVDDVRLLKAK